MGVYLETERLRLRQFTDGDADQLVSLDADPEVMHFITGGRPTPRAEIEQEVLPAFLAYHRQWRHLGFWAVEVRASEEFVGWIHLRPAQGHPPQEPELGYRLRRDSWGRGYAAEGCRALIDKAFAQHDVQRIVAETMAVHAASRRVMDKCGMRLVRTFHADWPYPIPGDEMGDVEYAITRGEWATRRGKSMVSSRGNREVGPDW